MARGGEAVSDLAHLPRGLLSLEQADERFIAYRLDAGTYRRVAALEGNWVRVNEPTALEFALDVLTGL
jgi:hypothetical protein